MSDAEHYAESYLEAQKGIDAIAQKREDLRLQTIATNGELAKLNNARRLVGIRLLDSMAADTENIVVIAGSTAVVQIWIDSDEGPRREVITGVPVKYARYADSDV